MKSTLHRRAALVVLLCISASACVRYSDVTNRAPYSSLAGRHLLLNQPAYLKAYANESPAALGEPPPLNLIPESSTLVIAGYDTEEGRARALAQGILERLPAGVDIEITKFIDVSNWETGGRLAIVGRCTRRGGGEILADVSDLFEVHSVSGGWTITLIAAYAEWAHRGSPRASG